MIDVLLLGRECGPELLRRRWNKRWSRDARM